jgi:4-carboxymuconolactone decarboxylase
MTRIPYPDPATLCAAKQARLADTSFPAINVVRMAMHTPDELWAAQRSLGRACVLHTTITDRERELLILRVAYLSNSPYELHHHLSLAKTAGLTGAEIDAMRSGDYACLAAKDRALAQFVSEVVLDVSPSDKTLAAMREAFGDVQLFEVLAIVAHYMSIARQAAVSGIELDSEAVTDWAPLTGAKA